MKFLSRLVEFKILVNWGMVHYHECEFITFVGFGTQLEDYNLHPSVNCAEFESSGKLSVMPLVGEVRR
jgi:hypothetical protein